MNWWEKVGALFGVGTGSGAKESLHYSFSHETCLVWPRNLLPWLDLLSRTSVEVTKAGKYWREEMAHGIEAPHPPPTVYTTVLPWTRDFTHLSLSFFVWKTLCGP